MARLVMTATIPTRTISMQWEVPDEVLAIDKELVIDAEKSLMLKQTFGRLAYEATIDDFYIDDQELDG